MFISLNGKWKLPIGYFFQNKVNAIVQAEFIKTALTLAYQSGLRSGDLHVMGDLQTFKH